VVDEIAEHRRAINMGSLLHPMSKPQEVEDAELGRWVDRKRTTLEDFVDGASSRLQGFHIKDTEPFRCWQRIQ
jgi:hypothetical protein